MLDIVGRVLLSWLAAIPRRLGDRLFARNDTEAYWRDWQITRTHGGLARRTVTRSSARWPSARSVRRGRHREPAVRSRLGLGHVTLGEVG